MRVDIKPWASKVEAAIRRGKSMGKTFPIALKSLLG
jgi:hypothetical protein